MLTSVEKNSDADRTKKGVLADKGMKFNAELTTFPLNW